MFDVISRIPGDPRVAAQKAGAPTSASSALYDQILRSVLLSMETPAAVQQPAAQPDNELHWRDNRTLEDVMMQRQFNCSLSDVDSAHSLDQMLLQAQPWAVPGDSAPEAANPLLTESLQPWELLLGQLTLQQRLAG